MKFDTRLENAKQAEIAIKQKQTLVFKKRKNSKNSFSDMTIGGYVTARSIYNTHNIFGWSVLVIDHTGRDITEMVLEQGSVRE